MNDCVDCQESAQRAWHGFRVSCAGCRARMAARSPEFDQARRTGQQDRIYRASLKQFGLTHDAVVAAAEVDALGKAKA